MKTRLALLLPLCATLCLGANDTPAQRLPRALPESQGVASAGILDFVRDADAKFDSFNSFMLVRHGKVVAEGWWGPYAANDPHWLYSLSKSFTSTAEGLAIADGKLSLDDQVMKFFPDETPADPSENLKSLRVRDLITMSSGHEAETLANFHYHSKESPIRKFLSLPIGHKPGTLFIYNSPGTFMQSAIVQKVTGQNVHDYLQTRLFDPLGFGDPAWEMTEQGVNLGASGLCIRTEDIASFGQMLLQKGNWNGKQLVPAGWIEVATAKQVSNGSKPSSDWEQGYGYQFWRCKPGFYRADGAFGQFCFVMPQYDAVLAITAGCRDTQGMMNLVYDKVLPALRAEALAADPAGDDTLAKAEAALTLHHPDADESSPMAAQVSGRTYVFPDNKRHIHSVTLQTVNGVTQLSVNGEGLDGAPITVGNKEWVRGHTTFGTDIDPNERIITDQPVGAIGGWSSPDTFIAKLCYYQTPYNLSLQLEFGGSLVVLNGDYNLAFSSNTLPELVGHAQ
ncbi:MAG TPA: serine hydrolase [Opitutaceae bacterium]|jgi:CubicO group peptidase (beta-lactamase class C family)|nr:serine hydrolase [Opitutaceae bacterium]